MLIIRPAQWEEDTQALAALDTSFVTERVYRPVREELSFRLVEQAVHPPLSKRYAFAPADPEECGMWDCAVVAEEDGQLAGFGAAQYVAWNRRVVVWHLYVAPDFRRKEVGMRLLAAINGFARSVNARCLWLETQNVNYPAIQFYRHCGFTFCGYDETLYDPNSLTPQEQEEVALYFARPVF